MHDCLGL